MDQSSDVEFVVDGQYENEKGIFTVLSIHKGEMVIRWESGEEIRTNIELQRNIQARRQWEELEREKAAAAEKSGRKSAAAKRAEAYVGFKDTDFKNSASGTKWRGRTQLGGAVTQKLPYNRFKFNSWAFANKPEMHWLDATHHKKKSGEQRPKFFARVNKENLYFGFSVGQSKADPNTHESWEALIEWLKIEENEETLHAIALKYEIIFYDKHYSDTYIISATKEGWHIGGDNDKDTTDKLVELISAIIADGDISLEVARTMNKDTALSSGTDIAVDISELFSQLMPLYKAAWTKL